MEISYLGIKVWEMGKQTHFTVICQYKKAISVNGYVAINVSLQWNTQFPRVLFSNIQFFTGKAWKINASSSAQLKKKTQPGILIHIKPFLNSFISVKRLIWCAQIFPAEIQEAKAPSPSINRQASIETDRVSKEFIEFLKTYHKPGQDIYKQCKLFLDTMNHKRVSFACLLRR